MSQKDHNDKTSQAKTDSTAKKPVPGKSIDLLDEELTEEQLEAVAGGAPVVPVIKGITKTLLHRGSVSVVGFGVSDPLPPLKVPK